MTEFKVGDRLLFTPGQGSHIKDSREIIVTKIGNGVQPGAVWFKLDDDPFGRPEIWARPECFSSLDPLAEAQRTLEEAGYTVTPPPEPMKGRLVVYKLPSYKNIFAKPEEKFTPSRNRIVLAIVDWVEGQGID